jgi:hypothetical protein
VDHSRARQHGIRQYTPRVNNIQALNRASDSKVKIQDPRAWLRILKKLLKNQVLYTQDLEHYMAVYTGIPFRFPTVQFKDPIMLMCSCMVACFIITTLYNLDFCNVSSFNKF